MVKALDIRNISLEEAADKLLQDLETLNFSTGDKDVECFDPVHGRIRYKLSEISGHVRALLAGEDDFIGRREVEMMRLQIAYERGSRR